MTVPSGTLLAQSALSGVFIGSLYGLLGLGVGLAWGLLHVINLAHFAFAFLAAYLCYQLASVGGMDPLLTLVLIVPLFAALGVALQWLLERFDVSPLNSLLATFGVAAIIEAGIQWAWTADFRKLESVYAGRSFKVGTLFVPLPELLTLLLSVGLALGIWAAMRYTRLGRRLRALAEDAPVAAAFGINRRAHALLLAGLCGALAGIAGVCLALSFTLTPSQDLRLGGRRLCRRDAGRARLGDRSAGRRHRDRGQRSRDDGLRFALVGADRLVLAADRAAAAEAGAILRLDRTLVAIVAAGGALATIPFLHLPAFYESLLYLVLHWVVLATSWNILSGYSGYFSFGHGAFFGAGVYTTAVLTGSYGMPFLWTLPAAAIVAAALGAALGAVVFRVRNVRGELFALLTLAVTFVLATIVLNTPIDGGPGVYLSAVPVPALAPSDSGSFDLLALGLAVITLVVAQAIPKARLGLGLYAIHDDEDAAEVMGVPTYRYKLVAFAISCALAGAAGGIQALFVSYVTAGSTFNITVPLTVVLMSVLGGTRHWAGPALGATVITLLLYAATAADQAVTGKAVTGAILVAAVLFMPDGILAVLRRRPKPAASAASPAAGVAARRPAITSDAGSADARHADPATTLPGAGSAKAARRDAPLLSLRDLRKSFKGLRALDGVDLDVREGEILGVLGPNGSGKSTLINVVSGHYRADTGSLRFAGEELAGLPAHRIARAGVARTYQIPRPFARLSVRDNVALTAMFGAAASIAPRPTSAAERWLAFTGLAGARITPSRRAHPAPDEVSRARARARGPAAAADAGRGAVGIDACRDRRGRRADPPHPRPGHDDPVRRARDARGHRIIRPHRRPRPGPRAGARRRFRSDGAAGRRGGLPRGRACLRSGTCASSTARRRPCGGCRSPSPRDNWSASWARTAPARPR